MGFKMSPADIAILSMSSLKINPESAAPNGFPLGNPWVPFQFPPKVTSEGKDTQWEMTWEAYAWEPQAIWKGNSARKITIHLVYAVTDQPAVGGSAATAGVTRWDMETVSKSVRNLKAYFTLNPLANLLPIFELRLYEHAPSGQGLTTTWRGMNLSIKHSESVIIGTRKDGTISAYPLMVECDLSMELVTSIAKKDDVKFYQFDNVPATTLPVEWY